MKLSPHSLESQPQVAELVRQLPITLSEDGAVLCAVQDPTVSGLVIDKTPDTLSIRYSEKAALFRALGLAAERDEERYSLSQSPRFTLNGAMVDCSRNAVPNLPFIKGYIRQLALMGLNTLMLYTEDTYEIGNNPYFGYMRGRFTTEELQEIDDYAYGYGIEVIPCIQTLAHLNAALRWRHQYDYIRDIDDILLVGHPDTYRLIEEMIRACRASFRSKRIHIGMDEAENLGRGKYRDAHGTPDSFDIICGHLNRVVDICRKYDFQPMIWSDMFFKLVSNGSYYDVQIPEEILERVPAGVDLVYWDYYSTKPESYEHSCRNHMQFKNNRTLFAGGAWKWSGFAPRVGHSMQVSPMALDIFYREGGREAFVTMWGDNGAEASLFSAHPVVQLFAECSYAPNFTAEELAQRFKTCTGGDLQGFLALNDLDVPLDPDRNRISNISKHLLYQDPLLGLTDKHVRPGYNAYYAAQAQQLHTIADKGGAYAYMFEALARLADVLALKAEVGVQLAEAYRAGDRETLRTLASDTLPEIARRIHAFKDAVETQWFTENKPFGFEVLDIRLGGAEARAQSAARRVLDYAEGRVGSLPELEETRLPFVPLPEDAESTNFNDNIWQNIVTACPI